MWTMSTSIKNENDGHRPHEANVADAKGSVIMDFIPIVIFWSFAIWGLVSPRPVLLYLFFASMSFGSFAAVPPGFTGGLTFTPTPMVALLLIVRNLGGIRAIEGAIGLATKPQRLMLLSTFWVMSVFTTIFMPRLFAGKVEVVPMRAETPILAVPLQPTTQNISQMAYLTISVFAVFAFTRMLRSPEIRAHAIQAMAFGAIITVATGIIDFASNFLPLKPFLEPFRTATYALLTDVEVLDTKRVVGLMPEASSFGSLSLGFLANLYFFKRSIRDQFLKQKLVPIILVFLIIMVWLSTSSAAYLGLAILSAMVVIEWFWRVTFLKRLHPSRRGTGLEFMLFAVVCSACCAVLLFQSSLLDPLLAMVDRMVFQKTASSSFEERGMWTAVAWQAFLDTYGLGVGVGGARASNSMVAVFSNTGLLAGLCYYGFVALSFLRQANSKDRIGSIMMSSYRWSFIPSFLIGLLIGTGVDFGLFSAFRYGLVLAVSLAVPLSRSNLNYDVLYEKRTSY